MNKIINKIKLFFFINKKTENTLRFYSKAKERERECYRFRLIHRKRMPVKIRRILCEATSAALTVSLTDCMRFCAFPINISVASASSSEPEFEKRKQIMLLLIFNKSKKKEEEEETGFAE